MSHGTLFRLVLRGIAATAVVETVLKLRECSNPLPPRPAIARSPHRCLPPPTSARAVTRRPVSATGRQAPPGRFPNQPQADPAIVATLRRLQRLRSTRPHRPATHSPAAAAIPTGFFWRRRFRDGRIRHTTPAPAFTVKPPGDPAATRGTGGPFHCLRMFMTLVPSRWNAVWNA